jgi:hypothetical protein
VPPAVSRRSKVAVPSLRNSTLNSRACASRAVVSQQKLSKSRSAAVSCLGDRHVGTPSTEGWNQHETARVNHTAGLLLPTGYSY